jgi:hypothetical protein
MDDAMRDHQQEPSRQLYGAIMEEARSRLECIERALNGSMGPLPTRIMREFCYLQLRMLCELIGLACLTANGDLLAKHSGKLRDVWQADKIINTLERLNADFYPQASVFKITQPKNGQPGNVHIDERKGDFLSKKELLRLYSRVSPNHLHRGSIADLLPVKSVPPGNADIVQFHNKMVNLLSQHTIMSYNRRKYWICMLINPAENNRVAVAIADLPALNSNA